MRPFIPALLALAAVLTLLPTPGTAQDGAAPLELDPLVVTARGYEGRLSTVPGSVGVVDSEEITLSPKASLADAIARIPGVTRTGDSPWGQDISIRGLSGSSVVLLIDGKRVNTATDLNAQMGFVSNLDVERIEVLKGPVSALYGTGSLGGVVNIITKKGSFSPKPEWHGELTGAASTNGEGADSYGRAAYSDENLWVQLSGGTRSHEDYTAGGGLNIANSRYEDKQFRLASGLKWAPDVTSVLQILVTEANEVGLPGGTSTMPATAKVTYPRCSNVMLSLDNTWDVGGDILQNVEAGAYYMKNDRRVRIEDIPAPAVDMIRPQADHETWGGKAQARLQLGAHTLMTGADLWSWHMVSTRTRFLASGATLTDSPTPNTTMLSAGVFAEDDWLVADDWTVNLGARLDQMRIDNDATSTVAEGDSEDTGYNVHAGLTWHFAEHWSQSLITASSYRVADIMERFKNITLGNGTTLSGNPDLEPEQSLHLEYGLRHTSDSLTVSGDVFVDSIHNYISEKRVSSTQITMENVGRARIMGLESEANWRFDPEWSLYGDTAWLYGRDESEDEALPGIAPLNGRIGLRFERGLFWARGECQWAAGKHLLPDGEEPVAGWATANLAAGLDLEEGPRTHHLTAALNNLFDRRYLNALAHSRGVTLYEPGFNAELTYSLEF